MEIEKAITYVHNHVHLLAKAEKDPGKSASLVRIAHGLTQLQEALVKLEQRVQSLEQPQKP